MMAERTSSSDTRAELIKAAKSVFARHGYEGATVKEIADTASVNVSMVSYYFESKEGLYRACLEEFGKDRLQFAQKILNPPESLEDFRVRLTLFAEHVLDTHIAEPEITAIIHRDIATENPIIKLVFNTFFIKIFETFATFLSAAQVKKLLRQDVDIFLAGQIFYGSLMHAGKNDKICNEYFGKSIGQPEYKSKLLNQLIRNFMDGVAEPKR